MNFKYIIADVFGEVSKSTGSGCTVSRLQFSGSPTPHVGHFTTPNHTFSGNNIPKEGIGNFDLEFVEFSWNTASKFQVKSQSQAS